MSSIAEGSEGWAPEDELDLGPEDEDTQEPDHGALRQAEPSPQKPAEEELDSIDHAQDQASEKTVEPGDLVIPQTPLSCHAELGANSESIDETASNPDDSPSLHVSQLGSAPIRKIAL